VESVTTIANHSPFNHPSLRFFSIILFIFCIGVLTAFAQTQLTTSDDEKTVTVNDAPEMDVIAFGKSVIVKNRAKSVLCIGGDILVEGRVEEDVVAFGGSISQRENAYIGGHIFAVGGTYKAESQKPLRGEGKETIMIAAFEDELRDLAQNPAQIFSPSFTWAFLLQRLLSILFWFVVTFGITTLAPGAVSRGVARVQLSAARIIGIGLAVFLLAATFTIISAGFLPDYISVILGLMVFVLMLMSYVFGRVALQVSFGKLIQKRLLSERNQSETLSILLGVLTWTLLLSIPYVWMIALLTLFAGGIGLVLTARSKTTWQRE